MTTETLYHASASPNSRRVRIFLAEKGVTLPLVAVDLGKGEQHSDSYRAIKQRALVAMWDRRVEQEGFAAVMEAIRNHAPGLKGCTIAGPHDYEQIPALAERSRIRVANSFRELDQRLNHLYQRRT